MTEKEQRHKTIWLLIAAVLVLIALGLNNKPAKAQINCRLVIWSDKTARMSFVFKECWKTPDQVEVLPMVIPRSKPVIKVAAVEKKVVKRRGVCGSKRQIWRTLKNGHRKFRCK